ncbi:MAG: hypothetical protein IJ608_14355 [Lachnospiraceae bacterium]|nr:hypothetical protein [Lachnospiraceae bacterium]
MSDDKRREELKAEINKKLDQLSVEALEKVAGGFIKYSEYKCEKCGAILSPFEDHKCRGYLQTTHLSDPSLKDAN